LSFTDTSIWLNTRPKELTSFPVPELFYPREEGEHEDGLRAWRLGGGHFRLLYADGTEFIVNHSGTEIYANWPDTSTIEDTSIYLLGPVLGFALRLRGITCLHASAVEIGGRAVAFLGAGQTGKSTTAAAFAMRGYPVLTDDVAPLVEQDGRLHLQPTYPQLRLWPDSVGLLYGDEDALPRLTPNWTKRAMDLTRDRYAFQNQALPLAAIYVLGEKAADSEPRIEPIAGREAVRTLLAHSYVGYLLDRAMREREFAEVTRLACQVAVRRVVSSDGSSPVFDLCSRILDDFEEIGCTASPTTAR
jgi:hypothetical protein